LSKSLLRFSRRFTTTPLHQQQQQPDEMMAQLIFSRAGCGQEGTSETGCPDSSSSSSNNNNRGKIQTAKPLPVSLSLQSPEQRKREYHARHAVVEERRRSLLPASQHSSSLPPEPLHHLEGRNHDSRDVVQHSYEFFQQSPQANARTSSK
jgi:hypothetical protein